MLETTAVEIRINFQGTYETNPWKTKSHIQLQKLTKNTMLARLKLDGIAIDHCSTSQYESTKVIIPEGYRPASDLQLFAWDSHEGRKYGKCYISRDGRLVLGPKKEFVSSCLPDKLTTGDSTVNYENIDVSCIYDIPANRSEVKMREIDIKPNDYELPVVFLECFPLVMNDKPHRSHITLRKVSPNRVLIGLEMNNVATNVYRTAKSIEAVIPEGYRPDKIRLISWECGTCFIEESGHVLLQPNRVVSCGNYSDVKVFGMYNVQ